MPKSEIAPGQRRVKSIRQDLFPHHDFQVVMQPKGKKHYRRDTDQSNQLKSHWQHPRFGLNPFNLTQLASISPQIELATARLMQIGTNLQLIVRAPPSCYYH
jgi:hypothetical protein